MGGRQERRRRVEEGENNIDDEDEYDEDDEEEYDEEGDEDALRKLGVTRSGHRRPGVRRGQVKSGAMSGGPRKVRSHKSCSVSFNYNT